MRDVRDWNKYVDMVGKAVSKRAPAHSTAETPAGAQEIAPTASAAADGGSSRRPDAPSLGALQPPRRGRGPRKEETREELLSRLLDPTLTLEETARILEVCPTTVRRYTNKGILPHQRSAGNQRRFKLSTVLAFEARLRAEAGEEATAEEAAAE